jgi:hypothetical protein
MTEKIYPTIASSLSKNGQKERAIDEARPLFRSHYARLVNLDKSRLDDDEKEIIDTWQEMFKVAQDIYIGCSLQVLGITQEMS